MVSVVEGFSSGCVSTSSRGLWASSWIFGINLQSLELDVAAASASAIHSQIYWLYFSWSERFGLGFYENTSTHSGGMLGVLQVSLVAGLSGHATLLLAL